MAVLLSLFLAMRRTAPIVVDEPTLGFRIMMMPELCLSPAAFPAGSLPGATVGDG